MAPRDLERTVQLFICLALKTLEVGLRVDVVETTNDVANPRQLVLEVPVAGEDVCLTDRRPGSGITAECCLAYYVMFDF